MFRKKNEVHSNSLNMHQSCQKRIKNECKRACRHTPGTPKKGYKQALKHIFAFAVRFEAKVHLVCNINPCSEAPDTATVNGLFSLGGITMYFFLTSAVVPALCLPAVQPLRSSSFKPE